MSFGRRRYAFWGMIICIISMAAFGTVKWINNKTMFIITSVVFRLISGVGSSFIHVAVYAMAAIKWPNEVQDKIGILEAASGAGLFLGPVVGGIVYQLTAYCVPFFGFSAILLVLTPFIVKNLTEELDAASPEGESSSSDLGNEVSMFKMLKYKRVLFATLAQFVNLIIFTFPDPVLGPRLEDGFGLGALVTGLIFGVPIVAYVATGPFIIQPVTKHFQKRTTIMIGYIFIMLALLFDGPSATLGLPDSLVFIIIGLFFTGMGAASTVIPIIPEMLDAVEGEFVNEVAVKDAASGMFNMANGFGQIVGPVMAGALADAVGFRYCCDILALMVFLFLAAYIIVCDGWGALKRSLNDTRIARRRGNVDKPTEHHLLGESASENDNDSDELYDPEKPTKKGSDGSGDRSISTNDGYSLNT